MFTLGHSLTLLAGVLGGIHANSFVVDAIIGFSVVYKAFDNLGGFTEAAGFEPNTVQPCWIFGLNSTDRLAWPRSFRNWIYPETALIANIVSVQRGRRDRPAIRRFYLPWLIVLSYWRTRSGFLRHAFATNTVLMAVGFVLTGYQIAGYFLAA